MPVGFQSIADDGTYQIDENFINLSYISQGSLTFAGGNESGVFYQDVSFTGDMPLIFVTSPVANSLTMGIIRSSKVGSTWTVRIGAYGTTYGATYYIFDSPSPVSSGSGLEVYRADGKLVYSSNYKRCNIVSNNVGTYTSGPTYGLSAMGEMNIAQSQETYSMGDGRDAHQYNWEVHWVGYRFTATNTIVKEDIMISSGAYIEVYNSDGSLDSTSGSWWPNYPEQYQTGFAGPITVVNLSNI